MICPLRRGNRFAAGLAGEQLLKQLYMTTM